MGDEGERSKEIIESSSRHCALFLADLMAEGVSKVKRAPWVVLSKI